MSGRLQKFIRTISAPDRSRTAAPQSPDASTGNTISRSGSVATGDLPLGYTAHQQMNILHKATNSLRLDAADKSKNKDREGSRERKTKDEKRRSMPAALGHLGHGNSHAKTHSPLAEPKQPAELTVDMESPPLVMYGTTMSSTGALMSGQFKLRVTEPQGITLQTLELKLVIEQSNRKPVEKGCPECTIRKTLLRHWRFIREEKFYKQGVHQLPFSYLLEGHLPASTETPLGSINYVLYGTAAPAIVPRNSSSSHGSKSSQGPHTPNGTNGILPHVSGKASPQSRSVPQTPLPTDILFRKELGVYRALPPPENDRTAVRVFPPTNLQAICTLPAVIHPVTNGFQVLLRLTGVAEHADMGKTVRNWKLKKLTWRLEEHSKSVSAACEKHAPKIGGRGKGVSHEEVHNLGGKELREGWKADYTPPALADKKGSGSIEMELTCGPKPRGKDDPRPACDVETPSGFGVHHKLVIECVVTEEMHPIDKPKWSAPTGVARILRMGFEIKVTERMGLGISWDEEQPPIYEDVPESPPGYGNSGGPQLGDDLSLLPDGIGGGAERRSDVEEWEEPPNYVDTREAIADDEEWDAHRVDFSEGVRPHPGGRSGSRGWSANGTGEGSSSGSQMQTPLQSPRTRPARFDISDLETDPYADMMRGRGLEESSATGAEEMQVGQRDD